jgi:cellulose synthase/poly-beta-1,6-N-acetylglucosamine synthase-like glycosyltransferase
MISVIITAYKESKTIGKAIQSILDNGLKNLEILVAAPDNETLAVAKKYKGIKIIRDPKKGKPFALNMVVKKAKGDILVLTDGDVFISKDSLRYLISQFRDEKIGAVSGNPVSINSKKTALGYWAYVLSNVANDWRKTSSRKNQNFFCSGYLFAIRKNLFPKLDAEMLSEDGFISLNVYNKGFKIGYSEKSKVFVKYPTTFKDWIMQKKRSAGGYNQIKKMTGQELRSFKTESKGAFMVLKYVSNFHQLVWMVQLFLARIYLWAIIYRDINLKNKSHKEIWKRVESTK